MSSFLVSKEVSELPLRLVILAAHRVQGMEFGCKTVKRNNGLNSHALGGGRASEQPFGVGDRAPEVDVVGGRRIRAAEGLEVNPEIDTTRDFLFWTLKASYSSHIVRKGCSIGHGITQPFKPPP